MSLQGYWEEIRAGLTIHVDGVNVDFHDGHGPRQLQETPEGVILKEVKLVGGPPDLAVWRRADGVRMVWIRAPHIAEDPEFPGRFHRFKMCRVLLRAQIAKAVAEKDWDSVKAMQEAWGSTWGGRTDITPEQEIRLARGRFLVPGVCVRHRAMKFRAVVLGCEPFVRAPVAKRMSERERAALGSYESYRSQPVYCCLIDDRDLPGGGMVYIPEADLVPSADVYPLESHFAEVVLEAKDAIQGYLPTAMLRNALKRQSVGLPFVLKKEE